MKDSMGMENYGLLTWFYIKFCLLAVFYYQLFMKAIYSNFIYHILDLIYYILWEKDNFFNLHNHSIILWGFYWNNINRMMIFNHYHSINHLLNSSVLLMFFLIFKTYFFFQNKFSISTYTMPRHNINNAIDKNILNSEGFSK